MLTLKDMPTIHPRSHGGGEDVEHGGCCDAADRVLERALFALEHYLELLSGGAGASRDVRNSTALQVI